MLARGEGLKNASAGHRGETDTEIGVSEVWFSLDASCVASLNESNGRQQRRAQ